ncbi:MAG: hypothetical protein J6W13_01910 [Salinivirgaceae bacterium]|nr:hypothetical protein [Salinivirgaceae bacterium]
MAKVYNPIYDSVFKHLMTDKKAAKVLLGNLLQKHIDDLTLKNNEYTVVSQDGVKIVRLDFAATIIGENGDKELATIELQKAFDPEEVVRFRKYLGAQYQSDENTIAEIKKHRNGEKYTVLKPIHIYAIYILGHSLGAGWEFSVMKSKYIFVDDEGKKLEIPKHNEFTDGLIHDVIIVQIPHLSQKPKNHLESLLSIFDQTQIIDPKNPVFINLDENKDMSDDYQTLVKNLLIATSDEDVRGQVDFEREMDRKFARDRYEKAVLKDALDDAQVELTKKQQKLEEQQNMLATKDSQLATSIKLLASVGVTIEQIAEKLNISVNDVKCLINN